MAEHADLPPDAREVATWRWLSRSWIVIFLVGAAILIWGSPRLAVEILGAAAILIGGCLALDIGGSARGAIHDVKRSRWSTWPRALTTVPFFRVFGALFAVIGVVFLTVGILDVVSSRQ